MNRLSLIFLVAMSTVLVSFDSADACNRCRRTRCCRPVRCCNVSYICCPTSCDAGTAPIRDCGCDGGAAVTTDSTMIQAPPAGDVITEDATSGSSPIQGDVVPTEAPSVPEAPAE